MEGAHKSFRGDVPYTMIIDGNVGGQKFQVVGKGVGNAVTGYQRGKWVSKTGKLPISWQALSSTLGYGYKCFIKYPNGMNHFYIDTFPEGYSHDRTISFEGDGCFRVRHETTLQKGVVVNNVKFEAEGFKADSPVINGGIGVNLPAVGTYYEVEGGLKSITPQLYPLKNPVGISKYAVAQVVTVNKPLGTPHNIKIPAPHFVQSHTRQFKDVDDNSEHICQHERLDGFDFALLDDNNPK